MSLSNLIGLRTTDEEKIVCRNCEYAIKGGIGKATCKKFDGKKNNYKSENVCFNNAPCPEYKKGENLIKYEVEI
jgi:hypothetical protein